MSPFFLTLGRYLPTGSMLHRLDARAKLLMAILLACACVVSSEVVSQFLMSVFLMVGFKQSRLPFRLLGRALGAIIWFIAFIVLANLTWGWVAMHVSWSESVNLLRAPKDLAVLCLRLANLMLLGSLVTTTTMPVDASEALERLLRPLQRLHIPVQDLGILLVLSLSFIPIFSEEAQNLVASHRIKMGLIRWRWRDRIRAVVPLMVPLFSSVFRRSDELAVALESRCYVPGERRTSLRAGKWTVVETGYVLLVILVLVGTVYVEKASGVLSAQL